MLDSTRRMNTFPKNQDLIEKNEITVQAVKDKPWPVKHPESVALTFRKGGIFSKTWFRLTNKSRVVSNLKQTNFPFSAGNLNHRNRRSTLALSLRFRMDFCKLI